GLAWAAGGAFLVSGGYDGVLQWHDVAAGRVARRVQAHDFWSWDLAASPDGTQVASVTGQYLAGSYRYDPAPEREPSVKVFDAATGGLRHRFPHVPPVQAVAFSPDGRHLAAGNLMGEIRVWDLASGKQVSQWRTDDLTSWGIIKSHHYLGGVFALEFSPDGAALLACGMGPMRDPMAGNGVQRWQRFDWRQGTRIDQTQEGESGQGLMEALAFHPGGRLFVMAGRLFQGTWNLALFEAASGRNVFSVDARHRITDARFSADGTRLFLAKARHQELKDGQWTAFGLVEVHSVTA
ncbi:MAG: WD40 repeat domain-containing protein, partial [Verrucomicrobiota bacterium]